LAHEGGQMGVALKGVEETQGSRWWANAPK